MSSVEFQGEIFCLFVDIKDNWLDTDKDVCGVI